MGILKQTIFKY